MRTPIALAAALLLATPVGAAELLDPDPAYSPKKVVQIQLEALQDNDSPEADAGIRQTWAFAHPDNKEMTGPLSRFTRMIESPRYSMLLNHRSHEIDRVEKTDDRAVFAVTVTDAQGKVVGYRWEVARVRDGDHAGAWMTVAVSPPMDAGDAI